MDPKRELEEEITTGLNELRELLSECSTYSVAGSCFAYHLRTAHANGSEERLVSPAKQIPFLLGVLLSGEEPTQPVDFGEDQWERTKSILDRLFSAYMLLYMPPKEELGALAPEWYRVREVSMLAFLHFFNTGLLASIQQIVERIKIYLVPFDAELAGILGIDATQALAICQWISDKLQTALDGLQAAFHEEREHRIQLLDRARAKNWSPDTLRKAAQEPAYSGKAERLFSGLQSLGLVSLPALEGAFPDIAGTFWRQFSIKRGEAPEIRYPTEQSAFELRPLVCISDTEAFCPVANGLFSAVLLVGERALMQSSVRDKFLRSRDKSLEDEALTKVRSFLSSNASIWSEVYETPDSQYEHDVIALDEHLCIVLEAKAAPPVEPFRDPDKAFVRLRDAFRADTGVQKAYQQANRVVRRLRAGDVVPLYDTRGREVGRLLTDQSKLVVGICVTRDNFGPLATNLALLLDKEANDAYPWVTNIIDLSNLAEAWSYLGWGSKELRRYLEQRIALHGKVFSDDELDYAGYFIRHGGFEAAVKAHADLLQLNPEYSSVFDDIYRHLHLGGPPVVIKQTEPVLMDLRRSLTSGEPVFVEPGGQRASRKKIGRNEPCPCGSGKKYKRCCRAAH